MIIYSIYKIVCTITNKVYIGQTKRDINQRFKEHTRNNRSPRHKLGGSISKYGPENHYIETIFCCLTYEDMNYWESYFEKEYNSLVDGLNTISAGQQKGFTKPKSFGEKLSKSRIEKFKSGELNPVKSCLGKKLYVNLESMENKFFKDYPGEGWILSRIYIKQKNEEKRKSRVNRTKFPPWFNVELHKEIRSEKCPGEGWLKGKAPWNIRRGHTQSEHQKSRAKEGNQSTYRIEFLDGTYEDIKSLQIIYEKYNLKQGDVRSLYNNKSISGISYERIMNAKIKSLRILETKFLDKLDVQ